MKVTIMLADNAGGPPYTTLAETSGEVLVHREDDTGVIKIGERAFQFWPLIEKRKMVGHYIVVRPMRADRPVAELLGDEEDRLNVVERPPRHDSDWGA